MTVIVPSRHRPESIRRLAEAWIATGAETDLAVGVDDDDDVDAYCEALRDLPRAGITVFPHTNMNTTLNRMAVELAATGSYDVIGFAGDDHVPRTEHWDSTIARKVMERPCSIVYGNDLFQGPNLPTAVFMDARIIRTLGYMAPPLMRHLYLDDAWKMWGQSLGSLVYLPDVVIEHMHPEAGKAEWDEGHKRVNAAEVYEHDRQRWDEYNASAGLARDVAKLRIAMKEAA
jgi:hypothetical protein